MPDDLFTLPNHTKLAAAGYKPVPAWGSIYWEHPVTHTWYSEEAALALVEREQQKEQPS